MPSLESRIRKVGRIFRDRSLFRAAAHGGSNDVVDNGRLLDPAQVSGPVERDDRRLRQSAREMGGVLVGHYTVGGTVHDHRRLADRSGRQPVDADTTRRPRTATASTRSVCWRAAAEPVTAQTPPDALRPILGQTTAAWSRGRTRPNPGAPPPPRLSACLPVPRASQSRRTWWPTEPAMRRRPDGAMPRSGRCIRPSTHRLHGPARPHADGAPDRHRRPSEQWNTDRSACPSVPRLCCPSAAAGRPARRVRPGSANTRWRIRDPG